MGAPKFPATQHVIDLTIKARPRCMTPRWARVDTATMASERPNPAISMPLEVVLHILDIVSYVERHLVDRDTLQSCSLVCRAWSFPAQDRLFREMYLHTPRASAAFTASMLSSPILSSSITSLHISIDLRQSGQISLGTFAAFVQSCPNVVHIDLAVYASRPVPSLDEHLFKLPRSSKISSLRLSNWTQSRELLPQLLEVWPTVRSLSLSGNAPTFSPGQSFVPCSFEDLRVNARPSPSVEFLQWLLPCSLSTLRKIELERTPSSETLSYITETYGATLTSLTLPSCGLRDHVYAVKSCNALEDFRIETPWSAPFLVAKVLPSTIRRIAFGINRDTPLQCVIDLVRLSKVLDCVDVLIWEGAEENSQLSGLKVTCVSRGVSLRLTRDISKFRSMNRHH